MHWKSMFYVWSWIGTLKGGQEARDSKRDFLAAAPDVIALGSAKMLGLLASVISVGKGDIFEVYTFKE